MSAFNDGGGQAPAPDAEEAPNIRFFFTQPADNVHCAIWGVIIYKEDFPCKTTQDFFQSLYNRDNILDLVVTGDDDADVWSGHVRFHLRKGLH